MQGRRCMIDVAEADRRLHRNLDPSQAALKASPAAPVKPGADGDLAAWVKRYNDALWELYSLAEALKTDKRRAVQDHVKAIGAELFSKALNANAWPR